MLIGLMGHAGSGKDTVADHLVLNHGFVKVALADPLKRICKDTFNFTEEQLWGPSEERNKPDSRYKGLTPRKALQLLGTEWGRAVYEDVWIEYTLRVAKEILENNKLYYRTSGVLYSKHKSKGVVIPDVRFQNEVNKIKEAGGKIVSIVRPGFNGYQAMAAGVMNHTSETEMDTATGSDCVIYNNSTLEDLQKGTDAILEFLNAKS